jgi:hypothetical protein
VNATGNWAYFADDGDRLLWLRLLERVIAENGWTVAAFAR